MQPKQQKEVVTHDDQREYHVMMLALLEEGFRLIAYNVFGVDQHYRTTLVRGEHARVFVSARAMPCMISPVEGDYSPSLMARLRVMLKIPAQQKAA